MSKKGESLPQCLVDCNTEPIIIPDVLKMEKDCDKLLEIYLTCVENHKTGLRRYDECDEEKAAYRMCTKANAVSKKK